MKTSKRMFLTGVCASSLWVAARWVYAQTKPLDANGVARHYGVLVNAGYDDTLTSALDLRKSILAFLDQPTAAGLDAARAAWRAAREIYGQTEAFRFYGGPIDDDKGPEGRLNSWPLDESYIDYVKGKPNAGVIADRKAHSPSGDAGDIAALQSSWLLSCPPDDQVQRLSIAGAIEAALQLDAACALAADADALSAWITGGAELRRTAEAHTLQTLPAGGQFDNHAILWIGSMPGS